MTFVWPLALLGLLLVPLVLGGYVLLQRRRSKYAVRFTNLDLLANVVDSSPRWRRHVPAAIFLVALSALLVGVARPQMVTTTAKKQSTVVLAIDVSGSMEATDVAPTRLAAARSAAARFLDQVPDNLRVGLVTFSSAAEVLVAPTTDHDQVRAALQTLRPEGGTAIGDAIAASVRLDRQAGGATLAADTKGGSKPSLAVVLLSDGSPSPDTLDPIQASQEARDAGVKVYTVALGTDQGTVTVPDQFGGQQTVPVPPDRQTLSRIAQITGGKFFDAPSQATAEKVYSGLGSSIATKTEKTDVTFAFAAGGAVLLLLAGGLSALWFGRLP